MPSFRVPSLRVAAQRVTVVLVVLVGTVFGGGGVSMAGPNPPPGPPTPPPPNPSQQQLDQSKRDVAGAAGQVAALSNQLAAAQAEADQLGSQLELRQEVANKALVDLQTAQDASAAADTRAAATHTETVAASSAIEDARKRVDEFIRAIYEQGVQTGSLGQLAEAANPEELVERAELTEAVAQQQRDALDALRRAQVAKVNADSLAREALLQAQAAQAAAVNAKHAADGAVASARSAVAAGLAQLHQLDAQRVALNQRLDQLTATDAGLRAQRQQYLAYQQQLASQNEVAARSATGVGSGLTGGVRSVINRALSQLGVSYAWGGGNGSGPTKGIRDGGVADEFGDYRKTGFDCSGLMIYAFEAAGISLPHYSGYQYDKGKKVPISQMRPGDMLFWADGSTIHHVALYIGNGKMIEAPYSGGKVRITAVRYGDGLMPYAIRLL